MSIKKRFNENKIHVIVFSEKLFLTNVLLNDDELKQIVHFYSMSYDGLKSEQRMYKIALGDRNQLTP